MDLDTSFGRWLRARRRALDLTQDDLPRRAGCAVVTIQKFVASLAQRLQRNKTEVVFPVVTHHLQVMSNSIRISLLMFSDVNARKRHSLDLELSSPFDHFSPPDRGRTDL